MRIVSICFFILVALVGLFCGLAVSREAGAHDSPVIYLKWDRQLSPEWIGDRWESGDPELTAVMQRFDIASLKPAVSGRLISDPVGLRRILRIELERLEDQAALIGKLRSLRGSQYVEPCPERRTCDGGGSPAHQVFEVPGDPLYGDQWFYPLMQAPAAWDLTHSDGSVIVAIVDNGTDWDHPDLSANIWQNSGETGGDGIDNDQNGYIDDVRGWDFVDYDNDPAPEIYSEDPDYHGSHTAGLVGALMNNGRGVVGMAPECKIMPVRTGFGPYISYGLEGIVYAAHNGADIISLSWGGQFSNSYERDVINDALTQGCLIVAAAGNGSTSQPHFPAGYDGVLSVAMTDQNDVKVSNSNYGNWVRVCAPGLHVLSLIPDGYGYLSGTSMSTPLVAGVAALVKSFHPTWDAQKIFAQVVFTADDISFQNPLYSGLLGSGRVNAYRALAENAPGIVVQELEISEISGDNDGRLDPGEEAALFLTVKNEGAATSDVQITLNFNGSQLTIGQSVWDVTDIGAGETATNTASPYTLAVSPFAALDTEVELIFSVSAEDFYATSINWPVWISPAFANHNAGNVALTLTNFGQIGYQKYLDNSDPPPSSGFYFPQDGANALYLGSLIAAVSADKVSDCAFGGSSYYEDRFDWQTTPDGDLYISPGTIADQEGVATFKDTGSPSLLQRIGLAVTQHSYAWSSPSDDDYVIVSYLAKNISGGLLQDLYLGLYVDWDPIFYFDNLANWDADRSLGYVYNNYNRDADRQFYGTTLLGDSASSYRVIDLYADYPNTNPAGVPKPRMSDATKYEFMTAGMVKTASAGPSDHATLLTAGPYSVANLDCVQVTFAILAGENLSDLRANADAALAAWNGIGNQIQSDPAAIGGLQLISIFPRPANDALNIIFRLTSGGNVAFSLLDVLGRTTPLWQGSYSEPGTYRLALQRGDLASGVYWLVGQNDLSRSSSRIIWLK